MRAKSAIVLAIVAAGGAGCGQSSGDTRTTPGSGPQGTVQQIAADKRDDDTQRANDELARAARAKDRAGVARAQRRLDELARTDPTPASGAPGPPSADDYRGALDGLAFKQGPLYVQQITTSDSDHVAFVSVIVDQFCLATIAARTQAANAVYAPLDARLRKAGVTDFAFLVVPVTQTAPTRGQALAIGRHGRLRLTKRGRTC